jgi:hypothetical protein
VSIQAFGMRMQRQGIALATATAMLHRADQVFMNGESRRLPAEAMQAAVTLADRRALEPASHHDAALVDALYDWYCSGYVCLR